MEVTLHELKSLIQLQEVETWQKLERGRMVSKP